MIINTPNSNLFIIIFRHLITNLYFTASNLVFHPTTDIAEYTRLQPVADRSAYAAQTAQIAAFEQHVNGLWGVFIVSVLSVVFLAGFAFLPSRY